MEVPFAASVSLVVSLHQRELVNAPPQDTAKDGEAGAADSGGIEGAADGGGIEGAADGGGVNSAADGGGAEGATGGAPVELAS